jgi:adenosine deaminase
MPKAELHRHLAGCVTPRIALEMAERFGAPIPVRELEPLERAMVLQEPLRSLQDVLARFSLVAHLFVSPAAVRFAARRAVEDAAADGVRYLELRFSPGFTSYAHHLNHEAVVEAVLEGTRDACRETGCIVPLLVIASREMGPDVCMETFRLAARHRPAVVGVDLAGDEDNHPPERFRAAFDYARGEGLAVTVHAGEQGFPDNVGTAIRLLGARRIGHGIRIVDRPDLIETVLEHGAALEICVTSNWIVGAVPTPEEHPLGRLMASRVPVSLNSDDPALFGITLSSELDLCRRVVPGLDLVQAQRDALDRAFGNPVDVGRVRQELREWSTRA